MFRNIPIATRSLLIVNIAAFFICVTLGGNAQQGFYLNNLLGLHFFMAADFHVYQLFTYMFMHGGWSHLFFNMFALWMFGRIVEQIWGPKKFLVFYLVCGLGAGLMQELAQFCSVYTQLYQSAPISIGKALQLMHQYSVQLNGLTTVGASGAVYGILLGFGMLFPEERIFIFPFPVPIKAKWFVIFYAAIELVSAILSSGDGVAHVAHLGGMLFGYFLIRYWQKHPNRYFDQFNQDNFFVNMRNWQQRSSRKTQETRSQQETQWHYTESKPEEPQSDTQQKIDAILEKIRRSGYQSLTFEEKQMLFNHKN